MAAKKSSKAALLTKHRLAAEEREARDKAKRASASPAESRPEPMPRDLHHFGVLAAAGVLDDTELRYWRDGDVSGLVALLRSDAELDAIARDIIAAALEGTFKRKRGAPEKAVAPIYENVNGVAVERGVVPFDLALVKLAFYHERKRLKAKGESRALRDDAIANVGGSFGVSAATIERLLRPPKKTA